jgi:hypothetical protein
MTLTQEEMVEILEDLARNGPGATARIQAIKVLREINDGQSTPAEGFAQLDELTQRRKTA